MWRLRLYLPCLLVLALIIPVQVYGAIYVYEDENGVKHYTNTPTSSRYKLATLRRLNTPRSSSSFARPTVNRRTRSFAKDPTRFDQHIKQAASNHLVDPLLIKAIIKTESGFDQYATSSKGAQGLMQLMPETAQDMLVRDPYSPSQNIEGGTRYFKKLLDIYSGDLSRSLAAYNAGPGRVDKSGPLPLIKETRDYVKKVTRYYRLYQQQGSGSFSQSSKLHKFAQAD